MGVNLTRVRLDILAHAHVPLGRAVAAVFQVGVGRARVFAGRVEGPHEPILALAVERAVGRAVLSIAGNARVVGHVRSGVLQLEREAPLAARRVRAVIAFRCRASGAAVLTVSGVF